MIHHAQAILQHSHGSLEPLVAKEIQKSFQEPQPADTQRSERAFSETEGGAADNTRNWDTDWFGNYE